MIIVYILNSIGIPLDTMRCVSIDNCGNEYKTDVPMPRNLFKPRFDFDTQQWIEAAAPDSLDARKTSQLAKVDSLVQRRFLQLFGNEALQPYIVAVRSRKLAEARAGKLDGILQGEAAARSVDAATLASDVIAKAEAEQAQIAQLEALRAAAKEAVRAATGYGEIASAMDTLMAALG